MQTITSKEVAEMLDKRHDNLLRAIRKYISTLGEDANSYFMEDPEKGSKVYLVTKAGCDLMAGRIIGEKSEEFKSKYLNIFGWDPVKKNRYGINNKEVLMVWEVNTGYLKPLLSENPEESTEDPKDEDKKPDGEKKEKGGSKDYGF